MKTKRRFDICLFGILALCGCLCGCAIPQDKLAAMSPAEIEAAKADADALVETGKVVAESGEALPFPLNLIAVAGGAVLIFVGGRKAAQLGKTAAAKVIVPAVAAVASKFLCKSRETENGSPAAETLPESATEAAQAADLTDFDGNGRDGTAQA